MKKTVFTLVVCVLVGLSFTALLSAADLTTTWTAFRARQGVSAYDSSQVLRQLAAGGLEVRRIAFANALQKSVCDNIYTTDFGYKTVVSEDLVKEGSIRANSVHAGVYRNGVEDGEGYAQAMKSSKEDAEMQADFCTFIALCLLETRGGENALWYCAGVNEAAKANGSDMHWPEIKPVPPQPEPIAR